MLLLTSKQLREWQIYYGLEPWGTPEQDLQQAYTRRTISTAFGGKRGSKGPSIVDLTLDHIRTQDRKKRRPEGPGGSGESTAPRQSVEEQKSILFGINRVAKANKGATKTIPPKRKK